MKLYPLVTCLGLLLTACVQDAHDSSADDSDWQEPISASARSDSNSTAQSAADGGSQSSTSSSSNTRNSALDGALNNDGSATGTSNDGGSDNSNADASSTLDPERPLPAQDVVVGYYPAWATYTRDFQVSEIPASKLTHINYAFANIQNGRCVLGDAYADVQKTFPGDNWEDANANRAGNLNQLRKLKAQNPKLRTLISVGGWTWSGQFSDVALTDTSRKTFATSCVDFMIEHGFDGIDIDWEYPIGGGLEGNKVRPEDKANYTLLLAALRSELTARQQKLKRTEAYLLSIAAPAGPNIIKNLDPKAIAQQVDWINVMSYDFHGAWEKITGHNAPLAQATGDALTGYSVTSAIDAYLAAGTPAKRLVMGMPFYGRSFAGVSAGNTHGMHQTTSGAGPGTWESGGLDYHDIVAKYLNASGFVRYMDESASVPYLFNATTGVLISYDDPASLRKKRALAVQKGLLGSMIWDLSSDTADHALTNALTQ